MPVTLHELLTPQVIVATISKISIGRGALSQVMGFQIGSGSIKKVPTRYASFRIFSSTRQPASFRAPGTGPAVIPPNPVGEQRVVMSRMHEKIILDAESLGNLSKLTGPNAQIDNGGQEYIAHQLTHLGEKFNAAIEVLAAGFIRGALYLQQSGDNWVPYLTNPGSGVVLTINFQLPAGNQTQLNMLGAGDIITQPWDDPSAPIVQHCLGVRSAMVQLTGMPLAKVMVDSTTWGYVINNTEVRTVGGTVQAPFDSFTYTDAKGSDGKPLAGMGTARLRALPWLEWCIIDDVLSIGGTDPVYSTGTGTLTKVVPTGAAVFMPLPDASWCQMWHGGELISEDVSKPWTMKMGLQAWRSYGIEPTTVSLVSLLNALPVPYREKAWAYATVTGF